MQTLALNVSSTMCVYRVRLGPRVVSSNRTDSRVQREKSSTSQLASVNQLRHQCVDQWPSPDRSPWQIKNHQKHGPTRVTTLNTLKP